MSDPSESFPAKDQSLIKFDKAASRAPAQPPRPPSHHRKPCPSLGRLEPSDHFCRQIHFQIVCWSSLRSSEPMRSRRNHTVLSEDHDPCSIPPTYNQSKTRSNRPFSESSLLSAACEGGDQPLAHNRVSSDPISLSVALTVFRFFFLFLFLALFVLPNSPLQFSCLLTSAQLCLLAYSRDRSVTRGSDVDGLSCCFDDF